ncbi:STAS/SEC14 domain-containing protein [Bacillus canaveralius]|uniref:STAS/SEC14 domain-containing protein n=2 Tax=Bacillus canaveralius TaxID=1403243 RepID=A0A2N5GFS3_9BACI|nr:STAS/SEC14 domain-containing protein [Bacillus canaveralius]PLR91676.1 STAS/SEC14 domain-containing protein [Bacillus canaveralius]
MITTLPSDNPSTSTLEFDGKSTKEDAEKLDNYVKTHFADNQEFNILAIIHDIDGSTLKGVVAGVEFDAKRWRQFNKFAVVNEKNWLAALTMLGNYLPGIEAKHFDKHQLEEARRWIESN